MQFIKRTIRRCLRDLGYDITRLRPQQLGVDPFRDMGRLLTGVSHPTILDVGANVGQSVDRFRAALPGAVIHSFEPSPATFAKLMGHCEGLVGVRAWNYGVGAAIGTLPLLENTSSVMSSFFAPGPTAWGEIAQTTNVSVVTLDAFADREGIDRIHVLKSDTQGYDFEVFKGAQGLMRAGRIQLIYYEVTVSAMYQGLPAYYEVFRFLAEQGFLPVSFYDQHYQNGLLSWMDVLFSAEKPPGGGCP
ncbi:MAG TPA: FkbM family methyltransferase [Blastocatellia bacterium]|jgi:FkbM family methyltransferase|nr:FkbM family methyltransferase [Blastocatellia bacterium]